MKKEKRKKKKKYDADDSLRLRMRDTKARGSCNARDEEGKDKGIQTFSSLLLQLINERKKEHFL